MHIEYKIGGKVYRTSVNHLHFTELKDGRIGVTVVKKIKGRYLETLWLDAKDVKVVYGRKHEL